MKYFILGISNGLTFRGRANRKEFWYLVLFAFLFEFSLAIIDVILFGDPYMSIVFWILVLVPIFSATIRRLHDIGKGGQWFFIRFIPFIGDIWLLILMAEESQIGPNRFGPGEPLSNTKFEESIIDN